MIMEKAWAKVHGSYDRIYGGKCYHILRDLTSAPSWLFDIRDDGVFEILVDSIKR